METHTIEEIQAASGLIQLNNISYLEDNLYHNNKEIRNHNRTIIAINVSNYLKYGDFIQSEAGLVGGGLVVPSS